MKLLIAPDSFKGSISSTNAAKAIETGLKKQFPTFSCKLFSLADGGEGTLFTIHSFWNGRLISEPVVNAVGKPLTAQRGSYDNGIVSVIELAQASGLGNLSEKAPLKASTYGTGLQIKNVLEQGTEEIILTLGGSATVDGGTGLMAALGARFLDKNGDDIPPGSNPLSEFQEIDFSGLPDAFFNVKWTILADVDNPVFGRNGGIRTYGPQKGLSDSHIIHLERKMREWVNFLTNQPAPELVDVTGSGAAGAAALPFLAIGNTRIQNGFEWISESFGLEDLIEDCDVVITGEGKLDYQTAMGKGPGRLAAMAQKKRKRVIAIAGHQEAKSNLFNNVFTLDSYSRDASDLMAHPAFFLERAAGDVARLLGSF